MTDIIETLAQAIYDATVRTQRPSHCWEDLGNGQEVHRCEARAAMRFGQILKALEPFEDISGEGDEDLPDETPVTVSFGRTTHYALRLADLRRVRIAINGIIADDEL